MKRIPLTLMFLSLVAELLNAQSNGHVSTASPRVSIIDTAFRIPQLNRTRRVWIYLPESYDKSGKSFPVLYMHDGQNIFDAATSFAGEWGADEAMDSISRQWIIVGIDNGQQKRMNEFNLFDEQRFGKGEGRAYLDFIVNDLKPFIDRNYRTKSAARYTAMAGSSMGGLISFYAGLLHPTVFGHIGVFSPSFWIAPNLDSTIRATLPRAVRHLPRFYFYGGQNEGGPMVEDLQKVAGQLSAQSGNTYPVNINAEGQHNEKAWRSVFDDFLSWLNTKK
ncbi:alpha/beta hydrolase [Flavihumibacter stibioxidans]|uniref:Alpha/beta hydrolase n=1 Tax=Flavihumibacter stibioxidans TaxID=1834163 RepID=A0ABR7M4Y7_9BACT|nr:alpha/beta hydrolase-fold protein [Flavihumibacter stibioxidans]MBC6490085.1 hypothetical protein [Flavihumibacter stibioxidans]